MMVVVMAMVVVMVMRTAGDEDCWCEMRGEGRGGGDYVRAFLVCVLFFAAQRENTRPGRFSLVWLRDKMRS